LRQGLEKAGRARADLEIVCVKLLATGNTQTEIDSVKAVVRKQLAFYGSTPAYRPVLDCHGWGALQPELNALSKAGRWDDMANLIDDEMLESIAIVRPRHEVAQALARLDDLVDSVSIENTRAPDPTQWADIVADVKKR
jgi:hypothetical protein